MEPRFGLHPIGLWNEDAVVTFYAPINPAQDSYSFVRLRGTSEAGAVEAQVRRLTTVMKELGHTHVDLPKIDIEGG
jgi:hypothetical protein